MEYLRTHGLSGGSEKRRATRMQVQAKIDVARVGQGRILQNFSLLTRDVSLIGMGLIQGVRVKEEDELIITLPRMKGPPLYVGAMVRHCRDLADNLYSVGAEFTKEITPDVVASLQNQGQFEQERLKNSILE